MLTLNDILSSPEGLFSVKDVGEVFKISDSAIWNWINYKKINCTKVGNTWVFKGKDIQDYLDRQKRDSPGGFSKPSTKYIMPYEK